MKIIRTHLYVVPRFLVRYTGQSYTALLFRRYVIPAGSQLGSTYCHTFIQLGSVSNDDTCTTVLKLLYLNSPSKDDGQRNSQLLRHRFTQRSATL